MITIEEKTKSLTKTEIEFLNYICLYHIVDKSLMRLIGYNYDYSGRIIKKLLNEKYIEETTSKHLREKENFIQLTDKGLRYLKIHSKDLYDLYKEMNSQYSGSQRQLHQLRGNVITQLLHQSFPVYDDIYLSHLKRVSDNSCAADILTEIKKRKAAFGYNSFYLSVKELRDLDKYRLRNITGTRCKGIVDFGTGVYSLYNHNRRKMKTRNDFERKMRDYLEYILGLPLKGSINFGRSYKPAIDTLLKTPYGQRSQYLMSRYDYDNQYFIPLTKNGSEQLFIFQTPNFREKATKMILSEAERENGRNMIYDGKDAENNVLYLGFECNISEIEKLQHTMETVCVASELKIYCFPFQSGFYKKIFPDSEIKPIEVKHLQKNINQKE